MRSTNNINTYQYGNTVRFECTFYDFDGDKIDPDMIKITIYNFRKVVLHFQSLGDESRKSVGEYYYDYTTDEKEQTLYYEWYGEIDGKPSLKRGEFITKFI